MRGPGPWNASSNLAALAGGLVLGFAFLLANLMGLGLALPDSTWVRADFALTSLDLADFAGFAALALVALAPALVALAPALIALAPAFADFAALFGFAAGFVGLATFDFGFDVFVALVTFAALVLGLERRLGALALPFDAALRLAADFRFEAGRLLGVVEGVLRLVNGILSLERNISRRAVFERWQSVCRLPT